MTTEQTKTFDSGFNEDIDPQDLVKEVSEDIFNEDIGMRRGLIKQVILKQKNLISEIKSDKKSLSKKEEKLQKTEEKIEKIKSGDWSVLLQNN